MTPKRWARVRATRAHGLRRGAWYTVVNDSKPGIVFLDVSKRNVAVDRSLLEFRRKCSLVDVNPRTDDRVREPALLNRVLEENTAEFLSV